MTSQLKVIDKVNKQDSKRNCGRLFKTELSQIDHALLRDEDSQVVTKGVSPWNGTPN
jgi:hypothetical protein